MSDVSRSEEWSQVKVCDLVQRHFSGPSPDCEERQVQSSDEWGVLKTTAVTWSGWNDAAHKVLPRHYWGLERIEVRAGDVLVTKAGPRHRVAVVTHVSQTRPQLLVSGKMIALRPDTSRVVPEVLSGLIALQGPQKYIHDRTTGMAESQVNFANGVLLSTPLELPPMREQSAIANIGSTLDTTIRQSEAIIEKLKQVKQGLLQDLLTRGIGESGELRPPQSEAPHFYKQSLLGWIPKEWTVRPLSECFPLQRGFDITKEEQTAGHVPVISSSGVASYHAVWRCEPPGVVIGRKGKLGGAYYVDRPYWPHDTTLWVTNFFGNEPKFCCLLLAFLRLERFDAATSVPTLNRNVIHPLPIAIPRVDEQRLIVQRIHSIEAAINAEAIKLHHATHLKLGLMDDLLTGRVNVAPLLKE